jgi:hypothetical protein
VCACALGGLFVLQANVRVLLHPLCAQTLRGHSDEILDVSFNYMGSKVCVCVSSSSWRCDASSLPRTATAPRACVALSCQLVTASADGTARVYSTATGACQAILIGHEGEISKVRVVRGSFVAHLARCDLGAGCGPFGARRCASTRRARGFSRRPATRRHGFGTPKPASVCRCVFCAVCVLCCAVLCCAVLCCAVLCCAVLCCAVLCCAVLYDWGAPTNHHFPP